MADPDALRSIGSPGAAAAPFAVQGPSPERRPAAGEEWLATTKHDGAEVESILIDQAEVGQASGQAGSGDVNFPGELSFQPTDRRLEVIFDEGGAGPDGF